MMDSSLDSLVKFFENDDLLYDYQTWAYDGSWAEILYDETLC